MVLPYNDGRSHVPASPKTQLLLGEKTKAVCSKEAKHGRGCTHTHPDLEEGSFCFRSHSKWAEGSLPKETIHTVDIQYHTYIVSRQGCL